MITTQNLQPHCVWSDRGTHLAEKTGGALGISQSLLRIDARKQKILAFVRDAGDHTTFERIRVVDFLPSMKHTLTGLDISLARDEDGTIKPRAHSGGQSAKLNAQQVAMVATLVEEDNDAILVELCERLEQRSGVRVSRATMGRMTQKLLLTRKKSLSTPVNETPTVCNACQLSSGTRLVRLT